MDIWSHLPAKRAAFQEENEVSGTVCFKENLFNTFQTISKLREKVSNFSVSV